MVHAGVARGHRPVPFLVQLRKLARGDGPVSIADYLASQVLQSGAGMSKTGACSSRATRCAGTGP